MQNFRSHCSPSVSSVIPIPKTRIGVGRGYGHFASAVALREARRIGLERVLLCTGQENAASCATIERAGGGGFLSR